LRDFKTASEGRESIDASKGKRIMASISSLGIGSGLDIGSLVDQLVAAETQPAINRLNIKEANLQAKLSAMGTLKGAVSGLQEALTTLSDTGTQRASKSSNPEVLAVTSNDTGALGEYRIDVTQSARAHSLASDTYADPSDVVGTGTITLAFGTTEYNPDADTYSGFTANPDKSAQTITIDDTNNTLEGIRDAINDADLGVNAVVANDGTGYRLLLNSKESGADNSLQLTVTEGEVSGLNDLAFNASVTNLTQTVAASDAQLTINGLTVTSGSNVVTEAIPGVTLDIKAPGYGEEITVSVAMNRDAVLSAVNGFISQYNAVMDQVQSLTHYDVESQQGSVLTGDSSVRSLQNQLRNALYDTVEGGSDSYRLLVDLGVTSDETGKLTLDGQSLEAALDEDFEAVTDLLQGVGNLMSGAVSGFLDTGGMIEARTQGIQGQIDDIGEQRLVLDNRIAVIEQRYVKQFTALDTLLGQLQNTSDFLSQQLSNLPTPSDLRGRDK
jgi:flagellar hook-associated protein 2